MTVGERLIIEKKISHFQWRPQVQRKILVRWLFCQSVLKYWRLFFHLGDMTNGVHATWRAMIWMLLVIQNITNLCLLCCWRGRAWPILSLRFSISTVESPKTDPILSTKTICCTSVAEVQFISSELMQRTRTDRTEPKVQFSSVLVLQFWPRFSSQFWEFSKIPELFENHSIFSLEMQKNKCKTTYVWNSVM